MADIKPFAAVRPNEKVVKRVAALPYDVYSRSEARVVAGEDVLSFLNIDRPETQFPPEIDMYAPEVYAKAKELLDARMADGTFINDNEEGYYLYELTWQGPAYPRGSPHPVHPVRGHHSKSRRAYAPGQ